METLLAVISLLEIEPRDGFYRTIASQMVVIIIVSSLVISAIFAIVFRYYQNKKQKSKELQLRLILERDCDELWQVFTQGHDILNSKIIDIKTLLSSSADSNQLEDALSGFIEGFNNIILLIDNHILTMKAFLSKEFYATSFNQLILKDFDRMNQILYRIEESSEHLSQFTPAIEGLRQRILHLESYLMDIHKLSISKQRLPEGGDPIVWLLEGKMLRFNSFRHKHPEYIISLAGKNLAGKDLQEAYLVTVDLSGANLQNANLENADLRGVNFSGAKLAGANLRSSLLMSAVLQNADLTHAKLSGSHLNGANFTGADIASCDFNHVFYSVRTTFKDVKHYKEALNLPTELLKWIEAEAIQR